MAEHVASASCIKIHMQRNLFKQRGIEHRSSHLKAAQRYFTYQRCKLRWLPTYKISKNSGPCFSNLKVSRCLSKTSLSCCMGSLASSDVLAVSDWIPVGDQILLIASMLLAYMAGVIPVQKSNSASGEKKTDDVVLGSSTVSGSARDGDDQVDLKHVWDVLRRKLLDSLDSIEQGYDIGKAVLEYEQQHAKLPLSLSAVAEGPKLRLLWASFEQLEQEVNKSSGTYDTMSIDDYITVFPKIIQNSLEAICSSWLEKELNSFKIHKVLVSFMIERLNGDKTILLNIINSGKGGLYAELLSFLRFGFQRHLDNPATSVRQTWYSLDVLDSFPTTRPHQ